VSFLGIGSSNPPSGSGVGGFWMCDLSWLTCLVLCVGLWNRFPRAGSTEAPCRWERASKAASRAKRQGAAGASETAVSPRARHECDMSAT